MPKEKVRLFVNAVSLSLSDFPSNTFRGTTDKPIMDRFLLLLWSRLKQLQVRSLIFCITPRDEQISTATI